MSASATASALEAELPYLELLADDLVLVRTGGAKGGSAREPTAARMKARLDAHGRFFVIVEFTGSPQTGVPSTQQQGSTSISVDWVSACVYVNAPLHIRAALKFARLTKALTGKAGVPSAFVATQDEAFEIIARFREPTR